MNDILITDNFFFDGCSESVKNYPNNPMLGRRKIVDGKVSYGDLFCYMTLYM